MEQEINEIIKKNLPAQVGETLKLRLEQAEKDAKTVISQNEFIKNKDETILRLNATIEQYKAFDERNSNLDKREKEISDKERNLEIEHLKIKLKAEEEKSKFTSDVAMGLVRNTEYRKSIYDSEMGQGYYNSQGQWVPPNNITKNYTETRTEG